MINIARLTLPMFLMINVTLMQNGWGVGVYFYYFSLIVSFFLLLKTIYAKYSIVIIPLMMASKILEFALPGLTIINTILSGILFFLVGLIIYSKKPYIIRNVLIFYLLLNVPIMLLQTSGVSSVLMYWNTDYSHTLTVLDLREVGTFKNITQYPTLFVDIDNLYYQIGQGRPSGLMPANNLLSVIIVFAIVMNLYLRKAANLNIGDIIVNMSVVISMSKLTLFVALFLYLSEIIRGIHLTKVSALKNILVLIAVFFLYYLFFPGILATNYRADSIIYSFGIRLIDLATTFGFDDLLVILSNSLDFYNPNNLKEFGHSSGIALAFDSFILIPSLLAFVYIYKKQKTKIEWAKKNLKEEYHFFKRFYLCIIFIFSVIPVFFFSPLFVMISSVGFYPLSLNHERLK